MKKNKEVKQMKLTWDDLADLYNEKTGGRARTMPMDTIYDWAIKQPDIKVTDDGFLFKRNLDK